MLAIYHVSDESALRDHSGIVKTPHFLILVILLPDHGPVLRNGVNDKERGVVFTIIRVEAAVNKQFFVVDGAKHNLKAFSQIFWTFKRDQIPVLPAILATELLYRAQVFFILIQTAVCEELFAELTCRV